MKDKVLIIGSGIAAITASRFLLNNGFKVCLISSNYQLKNFDKKKGKFSARINNNFLKINNDFINRNKIKVKNFSVIGSNVLGGLSNVWGGGFLIDEAYLKHHNKKNFYKEIKKNFKINVLSSQKNPFRDYLINFSNDEIKFYIPQFFRSKKSNANYASREDLDKLRKNKNFSFLSNHFITKIVKKKNNTFDLYSENNKIKISNFKKIVLGTGTIATTKILLEYFNLYNSKIRLKHNPQLAVLGFLKKKFQNNKKNVSGELFFKVKGDSNIMSSVGMIGAVSDDVVSVICNKFYYIPNVLIKFFFKILKNRIFVANCFLPNEYSNTYIFIKNDTLNIEGGYKKNYYKFEKQTIKKIKKFFNNFAYFTFFSRMPIGSDIHYTGTINHNNHNFFKLNMNYSLKKDENIYVIDGSILEGNPIYPGFYIINNAIDFSYKFSKVQ